MGIKRQLVCSDIRKGRQPRQSDLADLVCEGDAEERLKNFRLLAETYFKYTEDREKTLIFAERGFLLCGLSEDYLDLYVHILKMLGRDEELRLAYKTMGMRHAAAGHVMEALRFFGMSRDTYALLGRGNFYRYDFDILDCIRRMAAGRELPDPGTTTAVEEGARIRVAYIVFHVRHPESVIVKMLGTLSKYQNREEFECVFFVPEAGSANDDTALKNIRLLESAGAKVVQAAEQDAESCCVATARRIREFSPHILATTALLADYGHYYTCLLSRPAIHVAMTFGPPELYIPHHADFAVAATRQQLMDSPVSGAVVPVEVELPDRERLNIKTRPELGMSEDGFVIASAGRPEKFQLREYWSAILAVLEARPDAFFMVIGMDKAPPFLEELASAEVRRRVILFGWLPDYLDVLGSADVVVDTFPSGGGIVIADAMALSIPVVTFQQDYFHRFDQMNWSPGEDFVAIPELIVGRNDFGALTRQILRLAENPALRKQLGERCKRKIHEQMSDPATYVSRIEAIYKRVLKEKTGEGKRHSLIGSLSARAMNWLARNP